MLIKRSDGRKPTKMRAQKGTLRGLGEGKRLCKARKKAPAITGGACARGHNKTHDPCHFCKPNWLISRHAADVTQTPG
jgi:hypothetical protein